MENVELLNKLGLNKQESKIYLALIELGAVGVSDIAKHTGLHRPIIYKFLADLMDKNLVSLSAKGKRKVYSAESPEKLEKLFKKFNDDFLGLMPELVQTYKKQSAKPIIKFFTGKKGIQTVFQDLLDTCKKGDVFYRYESHRDYKENKKYVPKEYLDRFRDKMEVERLIITNQITKEKKHQRLGRLVKVIPLDYDLFVYDITQMIYGNKVAFVDFSTETATIIENKAFAQFQKKIFKLLFDKL